MKKIIFAILFFLLLTFSIGCALHSSNDDVKSMDELALAGVITDDVICDESNFGRTSR